MASTVLHLWPFNMLEASATGNLVCTLNPDNVVQPFTHRETCTQSCIWSIVCMRSAAVAVLAIAIAPGLAAQEAGTAQQNGTGPEPPQVRHVTAVYPLDGVTTANDEALIVDRNLPGLWKFQLGEGSPEGEVFVQGSPQYRKPINSPRCVAVGPGGEIYLGDTATREIYRVADDGSTTPLTGGLIGVPVDLVADSKGTLYIADLERRAVWRWNPSGGGKPEVWLPRVNARGLAVDSQDRLWVLSQNAAQLLRYSADGAETVIVGERVFNFPHNVSVDSKGVAWVSDGYAKTVWKVEEGKPPVRAVDSPLLQNPVGLFWHEGRLAIVDPHAAAVFRLSEDGSQIEPWFEIQK